MSKKPKHAYRGFIVTDLRDEYSFAGLPQTREQQLEIRKRDMPEIIKNLFGKPLRHLHYEYPVGKITGVLMEDDKSVQVEFQLDNGLLGDFMNNLIQKGVLPSLSLKHNRETNEVEEVSLCVEGARTGTKIINVPSQQLPSPVSSSSSGPQRPPAGATPEPGPFSLPSVAASSSTRSLVPGAALIPRGKYYFSQKSQMNPLKYKPPSVCLQVEKASPAFCNLGTFN
jgi:hypothetical protein